MRKSRLLDTDKLIDCMTKRKDMLYNELIRDFGGGLGGRLYTHNEVKYWKESIERGEFDIPDFREIYIILTKEHPEIADFTFYVDREKVAKRVEDLNTLAGRDEYWVLTLYSNFRNLEEDGI